jgi:hypothetical protein
MRTFRIVPLVNCVIVSFLLFTGCNSSSHQSYDEDEASPQSESSSECEYENGTHTATVEYYNPETNYTATYELDVEVENCSVVQISFPKGGWLDSDHITPETLDADGSCTIEGEDGKTYTIQLQP